MKKKHLKVKKKKLFSKFVSMNYVLEFVQWLIGYSTAGRRPPKFSKKSCSFYKTMLVVIILVLQ